MEELRLLGNFFLVTVTKQFPALILNAFCDHIFSLLILTLRKFSITKLNRKLKF